LVTFNKSKVDVKTIEAAIKKTDYTVKSHEVMNSGSATKTINQKECNSSSKS